MERRSQSWTWEWTAEHIRDWGTGLIGTGTIVAAFSLAAPDSQDVRKAMLAAGGASALIGGAIHLLGRIGQGNNRL